jgi:radical SAM protein with 4Fe4S-binding SPASM domain
MTGSSHVRIMKPRQKPLAQEKRPLLRWLDMELTERCNLDCQHCCVNLPVADARAREKELPTNGVKKILQQAVDLGCLTIRFTGGEPLLRADFAELYAFARRLGMKVVLFTNATLVTPQLAELFRKIPPLEKIEVTLYGMRQSSYDAVTRTPGSFAAAQRGIALLLESKVPLAVKSALLPANWTEKNEFETWAAATIPGMEKPFTYAIFFDLRSRRDSPAKNRLIRSLRPSGLDGLALLSAKKDEYIREMKRFCPANLGVRGNRLFTCNAGSGNGSVDAYGILQACLLLRHPDTIIDLGSCSFTEALTAFFPKLHEKKAENAEYLKRCASCFLCGLCEQCPAKSWLEHGTLDTPVEYFCELAQVQARFLGLLRENEKPWDVPGWRERLARFARS